jgi:tryptophanyl-tRNA synthetase
MTKQTYLTGITTTGTPHIGNYVGAIRPAIEASLLPGNDSYYFLADYHALIKSQDPAGVRQSRQQIAAAWLALGLDPQRVTFYRQSDIPEILELTWILTCMTAKGLMNRAHAYKAVVQENIDSGSGDPDKGITMGLFSYPVLMAADILMFKATRVPVGKDQIQHLEMARDIAQRFNHHYGELLVLPEAVVEKRTAVLSGLDGRKMSKSYNNTIPLFETSARLRKSIMKIKTNSLEPGEAKDPEGNTVFEIYQAFASDEQTEQLRTDYAAGIGWGDAKKRLYELVDATLSEPRERYDELMANPQRIESALQEGAEKARVHSRATICELRDAVGIGS